MNIIAIVVALALLAVPFFFCQMERWQVCGYWIGLGLYLANIVVLHSLLLGVVAFIVLVVSCIQVIVENFPIRL